MLLDDLDRAVLRLLVEEPKTGVREYARVLGVARGTVQSRIDRLVRAGVIPDFAPRIDVTALGYKVLAYVHMHVAQGQLETAVSAVQTVPEVLEVHTIAGEGDILCRVVAQDNPDLEKVVQRIIGLPGVVRTKTEVVLNERLTYRTLPLITGRPPDGSGPPRSG